MFDKFLPPTVLSLFSNGKPRNLDKKKMIEIIFYLVSTIVIYNLSKELERNIFDD